MVAVGGKDYRITHPASADALFDEVEFDRDESIPYWADLWPSAIALARFVSGMELSGKRVIELGCGVGLPSVVALERGAKEVVATDHYPGALDFAAYNARSNVRGRFRDSENFKTALLDWREPETGELGVFEVVLAADVLYERKNVPFMLDLAPKLLAAGGEMLLADPRRPGAGMFVEESKKAGFTVSGREKVEVDQGGVGVRVEIHHLMSI